MKVVFFTSLFHLDQETYNFNKAFFDLMKESLYNTQDYPFDFYVCSPNSEYGKNIPIDFEISYPFESVWNAKVKVANKLLETYDFVIHIDYDCLFHKSLKNIFEKVKDYDFCAREFIWDKKKRFSTNFIIYTKNFKNKLDFSKLTNEVNEEEFLGSSNLNVLKLDDLFEDLESNVHHFSASIYRRPLEDLQDIFEQCPVRKFSMLKDFCILQSKNFKYLDLIHKRIIDSRKFKAHINSRSAAIYANRVLNEYKLSKYHYAG